MDRKKIIVLVGIAALVVVSGVVTSLIFEGSTNRGRELDAIDKAQEEASLSKRGQAIQNRLLEPLEQKTGPIIIGPDFEIGYLSPPKARFMVFIEYQNWEEKEQKALDWLRGAGFLEDDICNLPTVISVFSEDPSITDLPVNHIPRFCK